MESRLDIPQRIDLLYYCIMGIHLYYLVSDICLSLQDTLLDWYQNMQIQDTIQDLCLLDQLSKILLLMAVLLFQHTYHSHMILGISGVHRNMEFQHSTLGVCR